MRQSIAMMLGAMALLGSVSDAVAQRERADRGGGRLDSQELRNDIDQDRLKKKTVPASSQQTLSPVVPEAKPKRDRKK